MGPNLVRNFAQAKNAKIAAICDFSASKREQAQSLYPAVKICSDLRDIMDDPGIDAVVIATPVSTHFDLGMAAMRAGKHVLVEKPLAMNSIQGLEMVEFAEQQRLVLMVGHTFVYTSAVAKIKELVDKGDLGQLYY